MFLICVVEFDDESDADWLRNKCFPAFENEVDEAQDEKRLDSTKVDTWWEIVDSLDEFGKV